MNKQNEKQQTLRELAIIAVGELVCFGLICGGAALLGKLDGKVLLGAAVGAGTAVLNYFLMAVGVYAAADRAENGEPDRGKRILTLSMLGRYALMAAILVVGGKSGACSVLAMALPLLLFRVLLYVGEFFRRKDG